MQYQYISKFQVDKQLRFDQLHTSKYGDVKRKKNAKLLKNGNDKYLNIFG